MKDEGVADTVPLEWLTLVETAKYLRVSEPTVRRLLRDGKLPAHRVGAQWRIYIAELREALLNDGCSDRSHVDLPTTR